MNDLQDGLISMRQTEKFRKSRRREGKVLVLLAVLLPSLIAIVGLMFDGGTLVTEHGVQQHATDAAATAAAVDIRLDQNSAVHNTAAEIFHVHGIENAEVQVFHPPSSGPLSGNDGFVEVVCVSNHQTSFIGSLGGIHDPQMRTRAVAGVSASTPGAAIAILDPNPEPLTISDITTVVQDLAHAQMLDEAVNQLGVSDLLSGVPLFSAIVEPLLNQELTDEVVAATTHCIDAVAGDCPTIARPALLGGLEIEGLGRVLVDGSVQVNTQWGGVDERGDRAGLACGPPYGVACMPLLSTTRLVARHVRVVGGVAHEEMYLPFDPSECSPLRAHQIAVPDPLGSLPKPTVGTATSAGAPDIVNVTLSTEAAANVLGRVDDLLSGLLKPVFAAVHEPLTDAMCETTFSPGVYNSLTVIAPTGGVRFEPGVYVICGKNPITQLSLCLLGPIHAEGVMFYITDAADFDATESGTADETPPPFVTQDMLPSVVIAPLLPGGIYSGLNAPGSSHDDMLIFQQRSDRRPIIIEAQHLLGSGDLAGTIYAKWGHTLLIGALASYDLKIASGTARIVTVGDTTFAPSSLFPPAKDVLLVE
ncbi:pilus assembly protein TadG-related protein [Neorhodopirellula lusitana]|uniref:pilus assembly protein TadG-related protein n=1 Tax=Neorhodopirellula lusitana TaxID=445327 RepID=UPI00384DF63C